MCGLYASARDDLGSNLLLPALTGVVLGGVDIFGGSGRIRSMVLGALAVGFLQQGLLLYGVNTVDVQLVVGVLLAVAIVVKGRSQGGRVWARLRQLGTLGQTPIYEEPT
jgi:ribose/xylose/arabinose/galactoside ABC-type transport system permease subunit